MKIKNANFLLLYLIGITTSAFAHTDFCSTPSTSVAPEITQSVRFDKKSDEYFYQYRLKNDPGARLSIDRFELLTSKEPAEVHSPEKWVGKLVTGVPRVPPYFVWKTLIHINNGPPEIMPSLSPGFPTWAQTLYPSFAIRPGVALNGFSFKSKYEPGIVQYNVEGFTIDPVYNAAKEYEEGTPNCPGWDSNSNPEDRMVTGMVTGPSDPDVTSVPIRVRGEDGLHPLWPVNPHASKGKVTVLVLSTRDFDAGQIDPASIQFGPGKVAPVASKVLVRQDGDDRAEEREDWERHAVLLGGEESRKTDRHNLLLTFDFAALEIQCVLDRAIFLRGKTLDGKSIIGGATTKLLGCDVRHPDVRPDHRKIEQSKKKHKVVNPGA